MDKINSSINYNGEELTYKDIINKQTSNLTKTVLDDEEFLGFSLHWWVYVVKKQSKIFSPKIYSQRGSLTKYSYIILRTTPIFWGWKF